MAKFAVYVAQPQGQGQGQGAKIEIGLAQRAQRLVDKLRQVSSRGCFRVVNPPKMRDALYTKIVLNQINSVNALSGVPLPQMLKDRLYRAVWAAAVEEAVNTFSKAGVQVGHLPATRVPLWLIPHTARLPTWLFVRLARKLVNSDANAKMSMLQDLEACRCTEIDFLNGEVVRVGEALTAGRGRLYEDDQTLKRSSESVETPVSAKLVVLVKVEQERRQRELPNSPYRGVPSSELIAAVGIARPYDERVFNFWLLVGLAVLFALGWRLLSIVVHV